MHHLKKHSSIRQIKGTFKIEFDFLHLACILVLIRSEEYNVFDVRRNFFESYRNCGFVPLRGRSKCVDFLSRTFIPIAFVILAVGIFFEEIIWKTNV